VLLNRLQAGHLAARLFHPLIIVLLNRLQAGHLAASSFYLPIIALLSRRRAVRLGVNFFSQRTKRLQGRLQVVLPEPIPMAS
jgi:hypothetical protein